MYIPQLSTTNNSPGIYYVNQTPINKFQESVTNNTVCQGLPCPGFSFFSSCQMQAFPAVLQAVNPKPVERQCTSLQECFISTSLSPRNAVVKTGHQRKDKQIFQHVLQTIKSIVFKIRKWMPRSVSDSKPFKKTHRRTG